MNYEVKKLEKSAVEVTITLEKAEIKPIFDKIVTEFQKGAEIPGFRKGKAPVEAVVSHYKEKINEEVSAGVLNEKFPEVVEKEKLHVISYARIKEQEVSEEACKVVFDVDVYPEFELANYKNLGLEKTAVEVTEELVDNEIKHMLNSAKKLEEVADEAYEAAIGDTVDLAFEGFVDGVAFEGGKADNFDLVLGSKSFIDTFEDQLVGYKKGQEGEVNVTFPAEYHSEALAGKPAVFKVKINAIKKEILAELNDAFAKENNFDNVEALKAAKKEELLKLEEERANNEFIGKIFEKIANDSKIDVPRSMSMYEVENRLREFENQLAMNGMKLEDYVKFSGGSIEALVEQLLPMCENTVKVDLIINKIAEIEKIEATEDEIKEKIEEIAKMYGMDVPKLEEELNKNKNLDNFKISVQADIIKKKTVDFLLANQ